MFGKRRRSQDDFDAEMQAHVELEADRLREEGMTQDDPWPRRAARSAIEHWPASASTTVPDGRGGTTCGKTSSMPAGLCVAIRVLPRPRC
jgi:hypothetical protein